MKKKNEIKTLAKKVLDMYVYQHVSVNLALALCVKDANMAVEVLAYIRENF